MTMKSIACQTVITGCRAKADRSMSLTLGTPELNPEEKALFMELINVPCKTTFLPISENVEEEKVEKELNQKTHSQRLRGVIFVLWKQLSDQKKDVGTFESFYARTLENMIEAVKQKIEAE